MKIRSVLISGWLLAIAAAAGEEVSPKTDTDWPPPDFRQEDIDPKMDRANPELPAAVLMPGVREEEVRDTVRVRLEIWELDAKTMTARLDDTLKPQELESWRKELLGDPVSSIVASQAVTVEAKSRALAESIVERIYPTEYEPPDFPSHVPSANPLGIPAKAMTWPEWTENLLGHASPTSYETRDTGTTFEAAVHPVKAEPGCWDLSVGHESVVMVARESYAAEALGIELPAFSSFRTGGLLRIEEGKWQLLSAQEPPRGLDGKPTGKSWLTLVRVDRNR